MRSAHRVLLNQRISLTAQSELLQRFKTMRIDELSFDHLESRFHYGIVVRAAFHAQRAAGLETVEQLVDQYITKLADPIRMKYLDVTQIPPYC